MYDFPFTLLDTVRTAISLHEEIVTGNKWYYPLFYRKHATALCFSKNVSWLKIGFAILKSSNVQAS